MSDPAGGERPAEVTCHGCATRQTMASIREVSVLDIGRMRELLRGREDSLLCPACGARLPTSAVFEVIGEGWSCRLELEADGSPPDLPSDLMDALGAHLKGVVGDLWKAADRPAQMDIVRERHEELTAEAIAAALLAAEGLLGGWVVGGKRDDPEGSVDDMLGPVQGAALAWAALSIAPPDGPGLGPMIARHISAGLVLPRGLERIAEATEEALGKDGLTDSARLPLLAIHAAAFRACGRTDPLASQFTRAWLAFAWESDLAPGRDDLERFWLSAGLLHDLVDVKQLSAAVIETTDAPPGWMERMQRIAEQAGHPRLVRQVATQMEVLAEGSTEMFRAALEELRATSPDERAIAQGIRHVLGALVVAGRNEELGPMTDHALGLCPEDDLVTRALILAQFGAASKDVRMPQEFLEKVGDRPRPWEAQLPDGIRLALGTERSHALRMQGRSEEAEVLLREFVGADLDDEDRWVVEHNLSMLRRDGGAADHGLLAGRDLLSRAADDETRFLSHQSLARTMTAVGELKGAIDHYRAALELAVGPYAQEAQALRAALATNLAAYGDLEGARAELALLAAGDLDARSILGAADAVAVLLERGEGLPTELVQEMRAALGDVLDRARVAGDLTVAGSALRIRGRLVELLGEPAAAEADWRALLDIRRDPLAVVSLAALRLAAGHMDEARDLLVQLPEALVEEHGRAIDVGAVLGATGRLKARLRDLSTLMMAGRPQPVDVRLAAELSRDAIGRTRAWSAAGEPTASRKALAVGLPHEALSALAPSAGSVWVLEWWEGQEGLVSLLTRIDSDGGVSMRALPALPAFAPDVAAEIQTSLKNWFIGRPGDPLVHPGWEAMAEWLRAAMADATADDHLVVIEHQALSGLPWHALDAVPWTTSYSPGWSALLDFPGAPPVFRSIGMVSVPERGEDSFLRRAFTEDLKRGRTEARHRGLAFEGAEGTGADAEAVLALLERSDLAVLHCHGLIDPDQLDLSLLVAKDGQLPTRHPIAAASAHGRGHRLTWRDLQGDGAAPEVVLSAACSSGQGLLGGQGERLGLFGALRPRGTRAVLAPAWDGIGDEVVAQLARVREMILDGEPLGRAVKRVGDEAAAELPGWRSRVLALDGDWR